LLEVDGTILKDFKVYALDAETYNRRRNAIAEILCR